MYMFILVSESVKRIISGSGWVSSKELFVVFFSQKFKTRNKKKIVRGILNDRKASSCFNFKPYPSDSPL